MTSTDKVTVFVPTRFRADTLAKTLRTIVAQTHANLEILVSNNGNDPATRAVVDALADPRIRHLSPPQPLSMSHNFEYGLSHVTGKWIVVIGDDDGVLPDGIERALGILHRSEAEALGSLTCRYLWPAPDNLESPMLSVPYRRGWRWCDSETAMRDMLSRKLGFHDVPITYTGGVVSTALYNRIKAVKGSFYQSQNPDCFSGFAFCSVIDRFVYSDDPLFVVGISRHSTGQKSIQDTPSLFVQDDNIPIHADIPTLEDSGFTFSFQAIIYECYLQTQYLRAATPITGMREQISAALRYARHQRRAVVNGGSIWAKTQNWARRAAAQHELAYDEVVRDSRCLHLRERFWMVYHPINDFASRYVVDPAVALPIDDINQASQVAARIRETRPSRLGSYWRTAKRRLARARPGSGA